MDIELNSQLTQTSSHFPLKFLQVSITKNQQVDRVLDIAVPIDPQNNSIFINQILLLLVDRQIIGPGQKIFFVDYSQRINQFIGSWPINQAIKIPVDSIINSKIQFLCHPAQNIGNQSIAMNNNVKNQKNKATKQRTIGEAMKAVREWRQLYDTPDSNGRKRKFTLDEAAQRVGVPKKSLDDYYNHIQLGSQYNFNFQRYKEQKMGILRKFVKVGKNQGYEALVSGYSEFILDQDIERFWSMSPQL